MKEYIEREEIMKKFADHVKRSNNSDFAPTPTWNQALQIVEDAPTADVVEVKHGEWWYRPNLIKTKVTKWPVAECDKCGMTFCDVINCMSEMYHYCPNCGAKMDGGGERCMSLLIK